MQAYHIREQRQGDHQTIEFLHRQAFWNLFYPACDEHLIVHQLRKSEQFVKELSLVVQQNEQIIAHSMTSRSKIVYEDATTKQIATLGPLCVDPKYQQKGVGSFLIKASLKKAKEMGFKAVVIILSYPSIYHRFGFKCCKKYNLKHDGRCPLSCMVLELQQNYLHKNVQGEIIVSSAFTTTEEQMQTFDKQFPFKERFITKSQILYQSMIELQWNQTFDGSLAEAFDRKKLRQIV